MRADLVAKDGIDQAEEFVLCDVVIAAAASIPDWLVPPGPLAGGEECAPPADALPGRDACGN